MLELHGNDEVLWIVFSPGQCDSAMLSVLKLFADLVQISADGSKVFEFPYSERTQLIDAFNVFGVKWVDRSQQQPRGQDCQCACALRLNVLERDVATLRVLVSDIKTQD
jgi:hypothetical protein